MRAAAHDVPRSSLRMGTDDGSQPIAASGGCKLTGSSHRSRARAAGALPTTAETSRALRCICPSTTPQRLLRHRRLISRKAKNSRPKIYARAGTRGRVDRPEPSPSNRETPVQCEPGDVFSKRSGAPEPSSDATKFVVRLARPSRKAGEHVLHSRDNRQPDIDVGDLTQPIQPAGNAGSGRGDGRSRRNRHA
jgi:hypothetical protein